MVWQDVFPLSGPRIDAEQEREIRLALQARAGADWALSALIARYQPPVSRYLTRLTGNAALSQQLSERIFVRMNRRLRGPHGGEHLRLWLLRACTEAGLDALRHPAQTRDGKAQLATSRKPTALLPERAESGATQRLRAGLDAIVEVTGSASRQARKLIWSVAPEYAERTARTKDMAKQPQTMAMAETQDELLGAQDPRETLRYQIVRAVLADLPYGDAQCLALHLIAGLNQAEVATALGITPSATRRRIVHGLQLFAQRYTAALATLGLPPDALDVPPAEYREDKPRVTEPPREQTAPEPIPNATAQGDTGTGAHVADTASTTEAETWSDVPDETEIEEQPTLVWKRTYIVTIPPAPSAATERVEPETTVIESTLVASEVASSEVASSEVASSEVALVIEEHPQPEHALEIQPEIQLQAERVEEPERPFIIVPVVTPPAAPPFSFVEVAVALTKSGMADAASAQQDDEASEEVVCLEMEPFALPGPELTLPRDGDMADVLVDTGRVEPRKVPVLTPLRGDAPEKVKEGTRETVSAWM